MKTPTKEQIIEVVKKVKEQTDYPVSIAEIVIKSITEWEKIRNSPK